MAGETRLYRVQPTCVHAYPGQYSTMYGGLSTSCGSPGQVWPAVMDRDYKTRPPRIFFY